MVSIKDMPREEFILPGNAACAGCGDTLSLRHALKALGKKTILVIPACCTSVIQALFPYSGFNVPIYNTAFASAAAAASGVVAGLEAQGKTDTNVVVWAGDGGTFDIGIQALSGAIERGTNFLYVCYNNNVYSNTGVQRSGATPMGAKTTTTWTGKQEHEKLFDLIIAAHRPAYQATANPAYPFDLYDKFKHAAQIKGPKVIHILSPCPPAWQYPVQDTVKIGKLAVETGDWILWERIGEKWTLSRPSRKYRDPSKRKPIEEYLKPQGRFAPLFRPKRDEEKLKEIQEWVNKKWELLFQAFGEPVEKL